MTFNEISQRAVDIREKYRNLELKVAGRSWTTSELMEGFVGDVGDLMKLVMAKNGLRRAKGDLDAALAHELADCLWCVMNIAHELNIDLEKAFLTSMDELEERIKAQ